MEGKMTITFPTNNLCAKALAFMGDTGLSAEELSKKAKIHAETMNKILKLENINPNAYGKVDRFLAKQKPKPPVSLTFKKFPNGFVFLYPDDSDFLPAYEKELVRKSGHGLLKRGSQYYCEGKFFFRLEGLKTFEEACHKPTEEELKDIFR